MIDRDGDYQPDWRDALVVFAACALAALLTLFRRK